MRMSECVVTKIWLRVDASDQKLGHLRDYVRVQAYLRLLNANNRRRIGIAEHGLKAQITKGPVRKPRGRHGMLQAFLVKKNLDRVTV